MRRIAVLIALALAGGLGSARAATTLFADGVHASSGAPTVVNATSAVGAADGFSAVITRPGSLVLRFGTEITGADFAVTGFKSANSVNVQIALGVEISPGVTVFTASQAFPNGGLGLAVFNFLDACIALSPTGCTLAQFTVSGAPGGFFTLDGISGVTPEPGAWLLMILGFAAIGARLKALRRSSAFSISKQVLTPA